MAVQEVIRKHSIANGTFYDRKSKYGSMEVLDAERLREPEVENLRSKKRLADTMLDTYDHTAHSVIRLQLCSKQRQPDTNFIFLAVVTLRAEEDHPRAQFPEPLPEIVHLRPAGFFTLWP